LQVSAKPRHPEHDGSQVKCFFYFPEKSGELPPGSSTGVHRSYPVADQPGPLHNPITRNRPLAYWALSPHPITATMFMGMHGDGAQAKARQQHKHKSQHTPTPKEKRKNK
jgi:hypothetical protein